MSPATSYDNIINHYYNNMNNDYYNNINKKIYKNRESDTQIKNNNLCQIIEPELVNELNYCTGEMNRYKEMYKTIKKKLKTCEQALIECKKELETMKEERMICLPAAPDSDNLCCICLTNEKDRAYVVCGHLCVCKECLKGEWEKKCPICRTKSSAIKIWK